MACRRHSSAARASEVKSTVFAQVTKHGGVTAQSDDRTQLIIRYNGPKPQAG